MTDLGAPPDEETRQEPVHPLTFPVRGHRVRITCDRVGVAAALEIDGRAILFRSLTLRIEPGRPAVVVVEIPTGSLDLAGTVGAVSLVEGTREERR